MIIKYNNLVLKYEDKWLNSDVTPVSDHYHYEIYISGPRNSCNLRLMVDNCLNNDTHVYKEQNGIWYDDTEYLDSPISWPLFDSGNITTNRRYYNLSNIPMSSDTWAYKLDTNYPKGLQYYNFTLQSLEGPSSTIGDVSIRAVETFSGTTVYNQTVTITGSLNILIPEP